eukprot:CAMPEP_0119549264 /NCGR_PEP_ID=MMETSP1352-20130426/3014_1 /TAXON_ID=265584 /ORGANISM="Stauroneis constricta, Strain CCMP1120" /LENGTH=104 /DNA_ID=CAMNT_0007594781 /DNA_START=32 /DNA_END=342 /DNA_ORIENTATION=+
MKFSTAALLVVASMANVNVDAARILPNALQQDEIDQVAKATPFLAATKSSSKHRFTGSTNVGAAVVNRLRQVVAGNKEESCANGDQAPHMKEIPASLITSTTAP